jgi:hypothetical protein
LSTPITRTDARLLGVAGERLSVRRLLPSLDGDGELAASAAVVEISDRVGNLA